MNRSPSAFHCCPELSNLNSSTDAKYTPKNTSCEQLLESAHNLSFVKVLCLNYWFVGPYSGQPERAGLVESRGKEHRPYSAPSGSSGPPEGIGSAPSIS